MICEWYLLCDHDAVGTTPHPVLGDVPICQRCADKHDLPVEGITMTITYELSHPQLSHPLYMDSEVERTDRALIAWASMYILRKFDEMVEREGWTVKEVARV